MTARAKNMRECRNYMAEENIMATQVWLKKPFEVDEDCQ